MSRTSASCHSSRRPRMAAVSITVISLLFPGVAVNAKSSMTARFHPSCMMSRRVGDEIELGGPIGGYFNWSPEDGGPVLLIGGGSGVVPFMSMLRHRAPVGSQVPATLVFSARSREELLFFDELSELAASGDGFDLMLTLTRETVAHPFRSGRIDAAFIAGIVTAMKVPVRQVLICGSNPFVEAAAEGTMAAGIDAALIKTERYAGV